MSGANLIESQCDGGCTEHDGEVRVVHVKLLEPFHDWGEFNYCNTAIEKDTADGFEVLFT
jgi:hypothetical protein